MVVVTVQRLSIWISGVKKKKRLSGENGFMRALVWNREIQCLYYYAVPVGAREVEGPEVDQSKSFLFPLSIPVWKWDKYRSQTWIKYQKISLSRRLTDHNISSVGEHYYQLAHVNYILPYDFFIVTSKSLARWKPLVCRQECNTSSFEIERFRFKRPVLKSIITWFYTLGKRKVKKSTLMISSRVSPKPSWLQLYN